MSNCTAPIGLDAGHGGDDWGATTPTQLTLEKDLNIAVARAALALRPDLFALIRHDDEVLNWRQRNQRAEALGCGLVVSIHHDNLPRNTRARGIGAYHRRGDGITRDLARFAVNNAPSALLIGGRVLCAHDDKTRKDDDWLQNPQAVVQAYGCHALLLEFGFMSNKRNLAHAISTAGIEENAHTIIAAANRFRKIHGEKTL
jgi:N-acetylmuramoyl-L-alanine amidase